MDYFFGSRSEYGVEEVVRIDLSLPQQSRTGAFPPTCFLKKHHIVDYREKKNKIPCTPILAGPFQNKVPCAGLPESTMVGWLTSVTWRWLGSFALGDSWSSFHCNFEHTTQSPSQKRTFRAVSEKGYHGGVNMFEVRRVFWWVLLAMCFSGQ